MRISISTLLRQSWTALASSKAKIEEIPEILQLLADFLKKEPIENFTTSIFGELHVPLSLNPEAEEHFKVATEKFKFIHTGGQYKWMNLFNFIYATGQVLTNIVERLESLTIKYNPQLEMHLKSLYHLWGSMDQMNAQSLVNKYKNKSNKDAMMLLISKLEASAEIIKKEVLPNL
jgi:hypothetical protein